jgi:hypothetical protein
MGEGEKQARAYRNLERRAKGDVQSPRTCAPLCKTAKDTLPQLAIGGPSPHPLPRGEGDKVLSPNPLPKGEGPEKGEGKEQRGGLIGKTALPRLR